MIPPHAVMTVWRIVTPAGRTFFAEATDHDAASALVRLNFPEVVGDPLTVAELPQTQDDPEGLTHMMVLTMPEYSKIGDTAPCKINDEPHFVKWVGHETLATWTGSETEVALMRDKQVRAIGHTPIGDDNITFMCV
jgi:hypothetical protein